MSIELFDYQIQAVQQMKNGSILCGGVGSGKSRTALAYYYLQNGGELGSLLGLNEYMAMDDPPKDLYIITTARKRDTLEWEGELSPFLLSTHSDVNLYCGHKVVVDSWNNIGKYATVTNAFFIFDEQRVVGSGAWVKAFLKIAKFNKWILLSATPGDTWEDYIPVFVANGFYKNRTAFKEKHMVMTWVNGKYPKVDRYLNTGRLIRLRDRILVNMDFKRATNSHHEDVFVKYDIAKYKDAGRLRWNPYKNEPITNAGGLCYVWRKIVNTDETRQTALMELFEKHPKMIVFYNFDYELNILKNLYYGDDVEVAEWNGHKHQPIPTCDSWVYLVQYNAGAEGWNCISTDIIVFYSQNYSYKMMKQAAGRIDRLNTPYTDLYYYHLKTRSGIDLAIDRALKAKKNFNEGAYVNQSNKKITWSAQDTFHVVSLSGGKDSTALLLLMIEKDMPIDVVITADTGMEFQEMYEHLAKLDEYLYSKRGLHITFLRHSKGFEWLMFDVPQQKEQSIQNRIENNQLPQGYGWPGIKVRWCTGLLKTHLINNEIKRLKKTRTAIQYIGIAADEAHRCKSEKYPLVEWGITEAQALQICYDHGFNFGGLYEIYHRASCWCCPFQRMDELRKLRIHHPELWKRLLDMDNRAMKQFGETPLGVFKENWTVAKLDERFAKEESKTEAT